MTVSKAISRIENDLTGLEGKLTNPISGVVQFIKDHKKVLIVLGVAYLIYRWLFAEQDEEWEE